MIEVGYGGLAVCPTGQVLAYGSGLWEIATAKKLRKVALPEGLVFEISFSPDGKAVAYHICEGLAQEGSLNFIAEAATGKQLLQIGEFDWDRFRLSLVSDVVFTPDAKAVVCRQWPDLSLGLHDVATGKVIRKLALLEQESVVGFLPDGRSLVSWQRSSGKARVRDITTGETRRVIGVGVGAETVILSRSGKTMAATTGKVVAFRRLTE